MIGWLRSRPWRAPRWLGPWCTRSTGLTSRTFWQQVHEANAHVTDEQRSVQRDAGIATLRENLADDADEQISAAGDW